MSIAENSGLSPIVVSVTKDELIKMLKDQLENKNRND